MATTYKQPKKTGVQTGAKATSGTELTSYAGRQKPAPQVSGRDYDRELLNDQDYERVQQARTDWYNALTDDDRARANAQAEEIRAGYGYSLGRDGATYTPLSARPGTSTQSNYGLQAAQNQAYGSEFSSDWQSQLNQMVDQILNRPAFSYDLNADALYDQYREQYTRLGQQAMQDTMGQAAGLTGGYGSTYATGAGQQAYYDYLDRLNDMVPELYAQARASYDSDTQQLYNNATLLQNLYDQDYQRWRDQVGDAQNQLSYWQTQQNAESTDYWNQQNYDFQSQQHQDELEYQQWQQQQTEAETAYSHQQDAWNQLYNAAMSGSNYKPTDAELQAAGMSREEYDGYVYAWQLSQAKSSGGGSGGGGSRSYSGSSGGSGTSLSDIAVDIYSRYSGAALDSRTVDTAIAEYGLGAADRQTIKDYLQSMGMQYSRR